MCGGEGRLKPVIHGMDIAYGQRAAHLLQVPAFLERLACDGAQCNVVGAVDVKGEGAELEDIDLAAGEYGFVDAGIDDVAEAVAVFRLVGLEFTLHADGVVGEDGGIDMGGFLCVEAASEDFVGDFVAGDDSHVVGLLHVLLLRDVDGEGPGAQEVLRGLVVGAEAEEDLVVVADCAPCRVHGVGGAVFVVGPDYQDGLGVDEGFPAHVFSHCGASFRLVAVWVVGAVCVARVIRG